MGRESYIAYILLFSVAASIKALADTEAHHHESSSYRRSRADSSKTYIKCGIGGVKYSKFKESPVAYQAKAIQGKTVYNVGVGYRFTEHFRADLNFNYNHWKYKCSNAGLFLQQKGIQKALLFNAYFGMPVQTFIPYFTVGIGISRVSPSDLTLSGLNWRGKAKKSTNFAWAAGAGLQYKASKKFAIGIGYSFINFGVLKTNGLLVGTGTVSNKIIARQGLVSLYYSL